MHFTNAFLSVLIASTAVSAVPFGPKNSLGRISGLEGIGGTEDTTTPAGEIDTVEIQPNNAEGSTQGAHAPAGWGEGTQHDTDQGAHAPAGWGEDTQHGTDQGTAHGNGHGTGQGYRGYNHGGPQFHRPNRPYHYPSNGTNHDGNRWHGQGGYGGNRGWHHNTTTTSPPPSEPTTPPQTVPQSYGNTGSTTPDDGTMDTTSGSD